MILWLTSLPLWQCAVLVIGLTTVGTMLLTVLIRRIVGFERLLSNNEVAGFKFAVLGVVYAVLLGFAVITVWEKFKQAQEAVTSEASASATVYRLTGGTEGASQAAVRAAVRQYLKMVVTYEANTMEIGNADVSTTLALNSLYNAVLALRPQGPEDSDLFVATLGELHTLAEARRERLELSRGAVPPVMWAVLIGGAVLTIAFAFFFGTKHVRSQVIMAGMLAAVIFMSVFVIININYPFTGELRSLIRTIEIHSRQSGRSGLSPPCQIPPGRRVRSNCGLVDILPTLVDIAAGGDWDGYPEPPDGRSLLPLLIAEDETRVAVSELFSEGVAAPYVMLRRGRYKFTFVANDPPQLFDLAADPDELHDLAAHPAHASLVADFHSEVLRRWDLAALKEEILRSQRRRRLVYQALTMGQITPWDFQPQEDASKRYYRGTNSYHDAKERSLLDAPPPELHMPMGSSPRYPARTCSFSARPSVSTSAWRLRPFTFLPAS